MPRLAAMFLHLLRRTLLTVGSTFLLVLAAGALAGVVRLMPWLASDVVPIAASLAFAHVLLLAAAEIALLVAPPLGCALEAAHWVGDGTARTLHTLGVGPIRLLTPVAVVGLTSTALALLLSSAHLAHEPGRFSNSLLLQSRAAVCAVAPVAHVPIVNVSWLCVRDMPRLVGSWPSEGRPSLAWSAADGAFAPDLSSLSLRDVHLVTREPEVRVSAGSVQVRGFQPWLVPATVSPRQRALAYGLCAGLASLAAAWCVVRSLHASSARALAFGIVGPATFLLFSPYAVAVESVHGLTASVLLAAVAPLLLHRIVRASVRLLAYRSGDTA